MYLTELFLKFKSSVFKGGISISLSSQILTSDTLFFMNSDENSMNYSQKI